MVPVSVSVSRDGKPHRELTRCRWSTIRCFRRCCCRWPSSPPSTPPSAPSAPPLRVTGEIEFQNAPAPVRINNMFAADNGSAMQASLSTAIPVAYVMQSGFDIAAAEKRRPQHRSLRPEEAALTIDGITVSRREVRAGDTVQLNVSLTGENGAETSRQRGLPGSHRRRTGPALLHRGRRQHRQPHRFPPGADRHRAHARPTDHHREQSAPQHQRLHPRVARRPGFPTRRRRFARPAGFRRADPGRTRNPASPASPRPATPKSRKWKSMRAMWSISGVKTVQVEVKE